MNLFLFLFNIIYNIIFVLLLARAVFSWIRPDPYHKVWGPLMRLVHQLTEPMLAPIRRLIPPSGMVDWSPLILLVGLMLLRMFLTGFLR